MPRGFGRRFRWWYPYFWWYPFWRGWAIYPYIGFRPISYFRYGFWGYPPFGYGIYW
ncbi:hypothetical protein J7K43_00700 [Candidatus Calescamantes bacterium]|nr:hypothetical protein [Candidatus Calescamantes bacterium]